MNAPWRSWSLRSRLMVVGLLGLAIAQAVGSVALAAALHVATERRVEHAARATAAEVVSLARAGRLPRTLAVSGVETVQVLDERGRVVSASQNADPLTALLTPAEVARALTDSVTVPGSRVATGSELQVWSTRVTAQGRQLTVLVAEPIDQRISSDALLRRVLVISFPLLLVVLGLIAWRVIGAAMRPVEELRSSADRISGSARGERLPVPPSDDEVHALAVTLNSMLDRLDRARDREAGFVADAAHELRSPLASMRMQIDVARRLGDGGQLAEELHADVVRLGALVDDLLALARLDASDDEPAVEPEPVAVGPVMEDVAREWTSPGVRIEVEPGARLSVSMGPGELERVLANLVANAARHAHTIRLSASILADLVVVAVEDDGPGVPSGDRERVFERFTRLDDARDRDAGGAGLGLAIVRGLVRSRGGDVRLSDAPAGGLRVEVLLPTPGPGAARPGTAAAPR
ncbi:HAMP domain-containing sensor histidine kinase [Nocardioides sp. LS1]|uniref:HAMP domain-containing sensor histidine kinase n=1 Tax=Nocardioides sp. LS1 TaxID=1027620 RepID=UPI000FF9B91A|nr:HAMP domain-containing sensor histidine kinase [Nocardioides sp. LS1]GCD92113.1 two-component sensor histidine kinase [Nocardioides sp. LS1]